MYENRGNYLSRIKTIQGFGIFALALTLLHHRSYAKMKTIAKMQRMNELIYFTPAKALKSHEKWNKR